MAKPTLATFGGAIISRMWEGGQYEVEPLGMEYKLRQGPLFKRLMKELQFQAHIDRTLRRKLRPEELERPTAQRDKDRLEQLQSDIAAGLVEITITCAVKTTIE